MRNYFSLLMIFALSISAFAQQKIRVHNSGNTMYAKEISAVDSIKLDNTYAKFKLTGNTDLLNIQKAVIDSITFTNTTVNLDKIYIIYNGNDNATIINPYANSGVTITATGGTVIVTATSGIANLEYNILGSSTNGSLTLTTDQDINLVLNNVSLTNPNGAPFTILGGKTTTIDLTPGTTNTLSDSLSSVKNGTITTDGPIIIKNTGTLSIAGVKKHGIYTTSSITILNGTTTITAAASDGLHSEGFTMSNGNVTISSTSDGIDAGDNAILISGGTITVNSVSADVKAIKTGNNTITINNGTFNLYVSGNASKAISAKGIITLNGGTYNINLSGAVVLTASGSGYDPSYCTGIKSDVQINVNGGNYTIQASSTATGGKGFSAGGIISITNGTFNISTAANGANYVNISGVADTYGAVAFSSNSDINISGGTFTLSNSGSDGKAISADGGINISGGTIGISNSGASGKGLKADGIISINGGNTTINLSGATVLNASGSGYNPSYPTGLKATGQINMSSGTVSITGSSAATGARGFSSDSTINITGGTITSTLAGNGANYTNTTGTADSYASAAFTSNTGLLLTGGNITTTSSGTGGKGLKSDGTITIGSLAGSPTLNITTTGARFLVSGSDYCHPKTIVATGAVNIINGNTTLSSTDDGIHSDASITISGGNNLISAVSTTSGVGEGVEAPIINFSGGVTNVTASNDGINTTYGTVSGGTESNDNSQLNISGGILIVAGKDAIDSNGNITITGGTTIVCGVTNSPEEGLDFNGTFNMNGGFIICAGSNSNMTKNFSATSTQRSMYLKSSAQLAATSMLHIRNASGTEMVTFKPKNAVYYFHFSSPNIAANTSYQVYFGGTYTGGNFVGNSTGWGLYTGGTYSTTGGTLKSTFTTSSSNTLNTITF